MHHPQRIEVGASTHVGKLRQQNEDSYLVATHLGVWAVADGMGGHEAGDVASRLVIEELGAVPVASTAAELLASCEARVISANHRLRQFAESRGGAVVGTTLAALLMFEGFYAGVWSGDSRIYLIRNNQIEQVSLDHTEVQELVSEGALTADEAREWPRRNVITRAIGVYDSPELEMKSGTLEAGDIFVLCTDGLTAHVENSEILAAAGHQRPQQACDLLVAQTLDRGATDNVTVLAVQFGEAASEPKPPAPDSAAIWD
jgi:protein phosphatase